MSNDTSNNLTVIRFTLHGFLGFITTMTFAVGLLTFVVLRARSEREPDAIQARLRDPEAEDALAGAAPTVAQPWGDLSVREIELERPEEYVGFDVHPQPPAWVFPQANKAQVGELLAAVHVPDEQVRRALGPELSVTTDAGTVVHPDLALALSLTPQVRALLYSTLGRSELNRYMHEPFRLHPGDIERWFAHGWADPGLIKEINGLVYPCGPLQCFSDFELVMQKIPGERQRVLFAKALSRQRALLVHIRVRPTTDLDKVLGYWTAHGARSKDLKPLLESVQRLPEGGTVSITDALPQFARQRLYTFPTPNTLGRPINDCHWSTFNFFNETPDDHFSDPAYVAAYTQQHYFQVAAPSRYGDIVFLVDSEGAAVHSAVYLADDIVFTKNGYGAGQPWMLMHLKDMIDSYSYAQSLTVAYYRSKDG